MARSGRYFRILLVSLFAAFHSSAHAAFSLTPSSFSNLTVLTSAANTIVKTMGLLTDHRAYEGAAPLGTRTGVDLSFQTTLVKLPQPFLDLLKQAGIGTLPIAVVPIPRFVFHKGLGERFDIGASWIGYREYQITGVDAKIVTYQPEEGPTWAIRANYTWSKFVFSDSLGSLSIKTQTFKPEILVSQKLDFAEPYLGVGYEMVRGTFGIKADFPAPLPSINQSFSGKGSGGLAFIGLGLHSPNLAFRLLLDGQYSTVGAHALGAKLGFYF